MVASFPKSAYFLARSFWPGPLTIVFTAANHINTHLLGNGHTIGIRIPDNEICMKLIQSCGTPITSTSANIAGQENPVNAEEVLKNFENQIDLIIDGGESTSRIPSTVVSVEEDELKLFREGAIPKERIEQLLGSKMNGKK